MELKEDEEERTKRSASLLKLSWVFGHENNIPAENISTADKKCIFYISGCVGISHDWVNAEQKILERHMNNIQCMALSSDKTIVATYDLGVDNNLVIWDLETRQCLRFLSDILPNGLSCMKFAPDNSYLLILTANLVEGGQELYIWYFMNKKKKPTLIYDIPKDYESQNYIATHSLNSDHFLMNNKKNVIFFKLEEKGKIRSHIPKLDPEDFQKPLGTLTQTVYIPHIQLVLSATALGCFLAWGNKKAKGQIVVSSQFVNPENREPTRQIFPHSEKTKILCLSTYRQWLVSGNSMGQIYFYDKELQIIKRFINFDKGPIIHISFSPDSHSSKDLDQNENEFNVQDFTISTINGYCGYCHAKEEKMTDILENRNCCVRAITTSSSKPYVCLGDYSGQLQLWNLETKKLETTHFLKYRFTKIECLEFDETCTYLACGLANGSIFMFDIPPLSKITDFESEIYLTGPISTIRFSPDSQYVIFVDSTCVIAVFRLYCVLSTRSIIGKGAGDLRPVWKLIEKRRDHYRSVVGATYNLCPKKRHLTLYTLGSDRHLAAYDLDASTEKKLSMTFIVKVDQTAYPTAMCWYPCFDMPYLLAISNTEHKVKIFNVENQKCIKVNILPIFNYAITKLLVVEGPVETEGTERLKYIVFQSGYDFGLLQLPIDGNPNRANSTRLQSTDTIYNIVKDYHDEYLLSSGSADKWVYVWKINYGAMQNPFSSYNNYEIFFLLASRGSPEWLEREIRDLSLALAYHRTEKEFHTLIPLTNEVLVSDLVHIVTALGYYPSKYEIQEMEDDINFTTSLSNNAPSPYIEIKDLVMLYVNHRPVHPTNPTNIIHACQTAFGVESENQLIPRDQFVKMLTESGEPIDEEEIEALFSILMDKSSPLENMHNVCIPYEMDKSYYVGKEFPQQKKEIKTDQPEEEKEEIDWGGLDVEYEKPVFEMDEEDKEEEEQLSEERKFTAEQEKMLKKKLEQMNSGGQSKLKVTEHEVSFEIEENAEGLAKVLPRSLSISYIVHEILAFPKPKKKHRKRKKNAKTKKGDEERKEKKYDEERKEEKDDEEWKKEKDEEEWKKEKDDEEWKEEKDDEEWKKEKDEEEWKKEKDDEEWKEEKDDEEWKEEKDDEEWKDEKDDEEWKEEKDDEEWKEEKDDEEEDDEEKQEINDDKEKKEENDGENGEQTLFDDSGEFPWKL